MVRSPEVPAAPAGVSWTYVVAGLILAPQLVPFVGQLLQRLLVAVLRPPVPMVLVLALSLVVVVVALQARVYFGNKVGGAQVSSKDVNLGLGDGDKTKVSEAAVSVDTTGAGSDAVRSPAARAVQGAAGPAAEPARISEAHPQSGGSGVSAPAGQMAGAAVRRASAVHNDEAAPSAETTLTQAPGSNAGDAAARGAGAGAPERGARPDSAVPRFTTPPDPVGKEIADDIGHGTTTGLPQAAEPALTAAEIANAVEAAQKSAQAQPEAANAAPAPRESTRAKPEAPKAAQPAAEAAGAVQAPQERPEAQPEAFAQAPQESAKVEAQPEASAALAPQQSIGAEPEAPNAAEPARADAETAGAVLAAESPAARMPASQQSAGARPEAASPAPAQESASVEPEVPKAAKPAQVAAEVADAAQAPEGIPFPTAAAASEVAIPARSSANENAQAARRLTDSAAHGAGPPQSSSEAAPACGVSEALAAAVEALAASGPETTATMYTQVSDAGVSVQGLNVVPQARPDSALSKFTANSDPQGQVHEMTADMVEGTTAEPARQEARSPPDAPPITPAPPKPSSSSQEAPSTPAPRAVSWTYRQSHKLGSGSFGVVFAAVVNETGVLVAIKRARGHQSLSSELQIMSELEHPCIVQLLDWYEVGGELNLVMEYCSHTLLEVVAEQPVHDDLVKLYAYQICCACAYIHGKDICHRDIKPHNILVDVLADALKLCDFGSAKRLRKGDHSVAYICSRYYRAPELLCGATRYGTEIDMWSTACVAAEVMLGHPMFVGENSVSQLGKIIKVLGTPTREQVCAMNPDCQEFQFRDIKPQPLCTVFRPDTPPDALDFIATLLVYVPNERPTALRSCDHEYFGSLRAAGGAAGGLLDFGEEVSQMDDDLKACISLQAKKSVEDLAEADLKGKTVLIRCDLNVPLNADLEITDETRITASIPTIEYLCSKGAKVLVCSHLGRPKDGPEEKLSLKPVAKKMGELMKKGIKCAPDCTATIEVQGMVSAMTAGDVLILENTRFHKGETMNLAALAQSIAGLADLFVNDAFGTAHRAHASTVGVTKFLKQRVSGFLLNKELDYLKGAVDSPVKPMVAIVGGAKLSTKILVIESMLDKVDKLVIGGGMVFTFLKARGLSVGNSLVEDDLLDRATKLEEKAQAKGVEIILPSDIACGDEFPAGGKEVNLKVVPADEIPDGWLGLDNGPKATKDIKAALADCNTIIWSGPMGVLESSQFSKGTYDVAKCIAELTGNGAISIIGGGDSVSAVNKLGLAPKMSHVSTGDGASLELLEGKVLPGVAALHEA